MLRGEVYILATRKELIYRSGSQGQSGTSSKVNLMLAPELLLILHKCVSVLDQCDRTNRAN